MELEYAEKLELTTQFHCTGGLEIVVIIALLLDLRLCAARRAGGAAMR